MLENKADEDYVESHFISRSQYGYLDNIEHNADIEALRSPQNADVIYFKYNNDLKELLQKDQLVKELLAKLAEFNKDVKEDEKKS